MKAWRNSSRKHAIALIALAVGMFGFAFALVPLYETFCEWTGLNGRTASSARAVESATPAADRVVTVQFLGQAANGLPWEFRPVTESCACGSGRSTRRSSMCATAPALR